MKLLLFPLIFLIGFSLFSMIGLGSTTIETTTGQTTNYSEGGWYDADLHQVLYPNQSAIDDTGYVIYRMYGPVLLATWMNETNNQVGYVIHQVGEGEPVQTATTYDLTSGIGLIIVVSIAMAAGTIAGFHFLGIGIGEESLSMMIKGGLLIVIWGIFSATAMGLITVVPMYLGTIFYFFLTAIYCLGIINQVGHPGED